MTENLSGAELRQLVERVFAPRKGEDLLILVDLPDQDCPDHSEWKQRRDLAIDWARKLDASAASSQLRTRLAAYTNVHANNADLPETCRLMAPGQIEGRRTVLSGGELTVFDSVLAEFQLIMAPTEFSATAPLKIKAPEFGFRAATMGGFSVGMIPALRLDYTEINRRVDYLKSLLDQARGAEVIFLANEQEYRLTLDLRFRKAHASGGLFREPGCAGNLPSGESYIVPYEGEIENEPSQTTGLLPVQFGADLVVYKIIENRASVVPGSGRAGEIEAAKLKQEPAYGNIAELGLGVLDDFGVKPCASILLDEKLGLHIAFGRSDHFGGMVGASHFSKPDAVVHIDRVYVPSLQPEVQVGSLVLDLDGRRMELMRDGRYSIDWKRLP